MKHTRILPLAAVLIASSTIACAAAFNSGSDGSYGPINVSSNDMILDMPADGIFRCTTITVTNGYWLRFRRNPLNTPVYLLATGDVLINGQIDVSGSNYVGRTGGRGGPGGFDGGEGGYGANGFGGTGIGGDGLGPGGGKSANSGVFGAPAGNNTNLYGNSLLVPLIGGSGGAGGGGNPGSGGGGGGGAILIASNTKIVVSNGNVRAFGGYGAGDGSGGAIRLVAPLVTGNGNLYAYGGPRGRVRIDSLDNVAVRSLRADNSVSSRGSQMFVFPPTVPQLNIVFAAGQSIPVGTPNEVQISLPAGAPTNHTVTVQARDFTNDVAITVAVIPNDRASSNYLTTVVMTNNPAQISVPVVIPADSTSRIFVWTR